MVSLGLNLTDRSPLVEQIVCAVSGQIDNRVLPPGTRLPSIRDFARSEQISRFTVIEAYDRLVAMGYLRSRRGSGFYAAHQEPRQRSAREGKDGEQGLNVASMIRHVLEDTTDLLKVGGPWLPDQWMDQTGIQSILRSLARKNGRHLLAYGNPFGYLPLRQQLQVKLSELGMCVPPEQLVLPHGTSQALDLVIRHLVKPGDTVLVDDPGYYNLFGYLRLYGAKLVGVPRNRDGPDTAALKKLAAKHRPKVYFTQSFMQNPTGTDMSPPVMHRVLQAAEEFDLLIVEDDTYCDLQSGPSPRLATLDQLNRVIYVRSFSKTLSGSLRVGFVACRADIAQHIVNIKVLTCITTSEFSERLVYSMLAEGHYRKFIERLRERVDQARVNTLRMMYALGMEAFIEPVSGNFIWARFGCVEDASQLCDSALKDGIMLAPGAVFRPNLEPSPWMRFNVALCSDPRLQRFLQKISRTPLPSAISVSSDEPFLPIEPCCVEL
jgi:DNA-binding transcriptional MocR family regulator